MGLITTRRLLAAALFLSQLFVNNARADILLSTYGWSDPGVPFIDFGPVRYDNAGKFVGGLSGTSVGGDGGEGATVGLDGDFYYTCLNDPFHGLLQRFDGHTGKMTYSATSPLWTSPSGVAVDTDGTAYVSSALVRPDLNPAAVAGVLSMKAGVFSSFIPIGRGGLTNPRQLEIGPDDRLYVGDNSTIRRYDLDGNYRGTIGPAAQAGAYTFGPDGDLYIAQFSSAGGGIARYNPSTGAFIDTFIAGSALPSSIYDMTFGFDHNLYLIDGSDYSIDRFNGVTGSSLGTFFQPDQKKDIHPFRISFVELPEPSCLFWLAGLSLICVRRKAK